MAVKTMAGGPAGMMDDYQAQDDLRTVQRAHEAVMTPKRHAAMRKHATKQMTALSAFGKSLRGKR